MVQKIKVHFFGEAATLSHVVRPLQLSKLLDPQKYTLYFSCDSRTKNILDNKHLSYIPITSQTPQAFEKKIYRGKPLFDKPLLQKYIKEDLEVLQQTKPDVIVGDLRVSLGISARILKIPYISIGGAHWKATKNNWPAADTIFTKIFGYKLTKTCLDIGLTKLFNTHILIKDYNQLARSHSTSAVATSADLLNNGDHKIYEDLASMYKESAQFSSKEHFMGPILWKPNVPLPQYVKKLPKDKIKVYMSWGSSGKMGDQVSKAFDNQFEVIVALGNHTLMNKVPKNMHMFRYVPAIDVLPYMDLVITNGGSGAVGQALHAGLPMLNLPSNTDQYIVSNIVAKNKCGITLNKEQRSAQTIRKHTTQVAHVSSIQTINTRKTKRNHKYQHKNNVQQYNKYCTQKKVNILLQSRPMSVLI